MKKINYLVKILVMIAIFIGVILITNQVYAGSINLNSLDFQIQLNEDGSMNVTENWNAKIRDTNTMFKDFKLDSSKFKNITNVEVYRIDNNNTKKLTKINEEMYHVTPNCYYALPISENKFEIAWGVSVDETETRQYQIKYKVIDVVKNYTDCSELYWQLVGKDNTIPVTKLTATIKLPKSVTNKNNIRGWAHGPYNGNITVYPDKVYLEVDYLNAEVMTEARIITLENIFKKNKTINYDKLNSILSEEQKWSDDANREREEYIKEKENEERITKIVSIVYVVLTIILSIFFIYKLIKNGIKARKLEKRKMPELDYFRDIPNKQSSAGDAAFLYYFKNGSLDKNVSKVISATLLQLSLKKYIEFSEDNSKLRPQVRIKILTNSTELLKEDEYLVLNLLKDVAKETTETDIFNMKEFEKYAKKNCEDFMKKIKDIENQIKEQQEKLQNYSKEIEKESNKYSGCAVLYISFGVILCMTSLIIPGIIMIINCIPHFIIHNKVNNLTDKGLEEKAKWNGLKRYMEDFSLLNEKEVPDLKLWEKYLVFATAFGIADKVLKQLKITYPELQNIDGYNYAYMNMLYNSSLNTSFLNTLSTSVNKVYMGGISAQAAKNYGGSNFSSGGGFGGGFSGGGGGRRWRRSEWAEDKLINTQKSSHSHMATF